MPHFSLTLRELGPSPRTLAAELIVWNKTFRRIGFVLGPNAEQCCLCLGVLAHFLHLVNDDTFWLILFTLYPALCLLALFLLPRLLFLALVKS